MNDIITLDYGSGGEKTADLIRSVLLPAFKNPALEALGDGEGRSCIRVSFSGDDAPHACKGVYPHARLGRGRPHERRLSTKGKKPALFHARSYGGTGHAVVVEGYFQASRKSDGQSLSVIQVADGWYSGVRYLNFYHSGLTNRTATLLY